MQFEVEEGKTLLCGPAADSCGNRVGCIVEGVGGGQAAFLIDKLVDKEVRTGAITLSRSSYK